MPSGHRDALSHGAPGAERQGAKGSQGPFLASVMNWSAAALPTLIIILIN